MAGHGPNTSFLLRLASIELPATGAVGSGDPDTLQLTATYKDAAGNEISTDDYSPIVVWASSATSKATVSQSGLVTKVAAGTSNVSVAVTLPRHLGGATITSNNCAITVS